MSETRIDSGSVDLGHGGDLCERDDRDHNDLARREHTCRNDHGEGQEQRTGLDVRR